jgi:hypothetical protein
MALPAADRSGRIGLVVGEKITEVVKPIILKILFQATECTEITENEMVFPCFADSLQKCIATLRPTFVSPL